jgi:hypothetical protein
LIYTRVYYMAVIAVQSPLEDLLALEHLVRAYAKACLIACSDVCFLNSLRACLKCASQSNVVALHMRDMYIGSS